MSIESRYFDGTYLAENPDWDRADSAWKAQKVLGILADNGLKPATVCEIGCGAGDVLVHLKRSMPAARMMGFDISPHAARYWEAHQSGNGVGFQLGDFHALNEEHYDLMLMLDVFEHVRDPFTFLENSRRHATHFVFHIPLDLSASSVGRGNPLLESRRKVGHVHYYTKDLALMTLHDSGYEVVDWRYTEASLNSPNPSPRTRLSRLPRRVLYAFNKDLGVRLLGGETLLVLARPAV